MRARVLVVFSVLLGLLVGGTARADVALGAVEVNIWERFVITETSCTGEAVTLSGRVHFVRRLTDPRTENSIISGLHLNSVTGSATSASGAKYILRDGSNSSATNFLVDVDSAQTFTATIRFRLIRAGEAPGDDDLLFRALFHVTVNANGETTAQFDRVGEFECR